MRKLIIVLGVAVSVLGCSKSDSDNAERELQLTNANLAGTYVPKYVTFADGTTQEAFRYCPTLKDKIMILTYSKVITEIHENTNCTYTVDVGNTFNLDANNLFYDGGEYFDRAIGSLTATKLTLSYSSNKSLTGLGPRNDIRKVVLYKE